MKFRKKPVVIEAWQWNPQEDHKEVVFPDWLNDALAAKTVYTCGPILQIKTLKGVMSAHSGSWIIQGIKGELYSCKPDIFEATYEKVDS